MRQNSNRQATLFSPTILDRFLLEGLTIMYATVSLIKV